MKTSHITGLSLVDFVVVNGRTIPVSCPRNHRQAQRDCLQSVARRAPNVHSQRQDSTPSHPTAALQNGANA